jgi:hypothetical protein
MPKAVSNSKERTRHGVTIYTMKRRVQGQTLGICTAIPTRELILHRDIAALRLHEARARLRDAVESTRRRK